MKLDVEFSRKNFYQLNNDHPEFVFCSNAGGSYVACQTNTILSRYNTHTRVQPYQPYPSSAEAGRAMDRAMETWAEALDITVEELTIGPSTSMNTYVMAQAVAAKLTPKDEIVVTNQDHEANIGVWVNMARQCGAKVRFWNVDTTSGLLDPDDLKGLLNKHTKWVFFTHCSNISGTVNPVAEITRLIKTCSNALVFVDGVSYAPHHIDSPRRLGVDAYVFSLYKVYGPHQSLMYLREGISGHLAAQCHFFNAESPGKQFNPAGPQHAQVAACAGVLDYFRTLYSHHFGESDVPLSRKLSDLKPLISEHETKLASGILGCLDNHPEIRVIGKRHAQDGDRPPTIAFKPHNLSSLELSSRLQEKGIGCESGNFYAYRLINALGIEPEDGVVRISLVHYSSQSDIDRITQTLDEIIGNPALRDGSGYSGRSRCSSP